MDRAFPEIWALCRLPRAEICFLRYTLDAYEGLCIPSTLADEDGLVRLTTSRELRPELEEVLRELAVEVDLSVVAWGEGELPAGAPSPGGEMERIQAHVTVEGRVQGVWFRASTREVADRLGLAGWVRNLADGRVEAVFEGPKEAVEEAVDWCRRGPPGASVTRCEASWGPPRGEPHGFAVRRD